MRTSMALDSRTSAAVNYNILSDGEEDHAKRLQPVVVWIRKISIGLLADFHGDAMTSHELSDFYRRAHDAMWSIDGLHPQEAFDELLNTSSSSR